MFSKVIVFFMSFFVILAAAGGGCPTATTTVTATPTPTATSVSQCNVNNQAYCCNSVQSASSSPVSLVAGLLGIVIDPITALVGIACTPITVIGGILGPCSASPVCCTNNDFHGLINIGCTNIVL